MNLNEIKKRKKELCLSAKELARLSGLPLSTVQKVLGGFTENPRRSTLLALEAALKSAGADEPVSKVCEPNQPYRVNKKSSSEWNRQGKYTLEDYLAIPGEKRVEMIDGVFYDMSSPSIAHQIIAGDIYSSLRGYINSNKGDCVPFIAPTDVQLDCDEKTIVQPDVFVVCDRNKIKMDRLFGSPDFVVEILSPSSRKKDMNIKTEKYKNAGVLEYWLVDPDRRKVIVYTFCDDPDVSIYGLDEKVPVGIYNGKCVIDFKEIMESVSFLYTESDSK